MKLPAFNLKFKGPLTIETIWTACVIALVILLLAALWGDYLIYENFITEKGGASAGQEKSTALLKKINLVNIAKKLREEKDFLESPSFQFVESPF